jgi:mannan endo-1,4-beta-mannosidase
MKLMPTILSLISILTPTLTRGATVDPNITKETKALYANLKKISAKGIMFGHQDDALYGHTWKYDADASDVKSVAGDYPAVFGWELGNLELGCAQSLDSVNFDTIRQRIKEVYRRGAVNTISWHVNNPLGGNAWNCNTTEAVKSILPGGTKNALFRQWLDRVATFLGSLKDDRGKMIPILFRPFHEHTGTWFWWGRKQCSPQEYISLWKYTVNYLVKTKRLHNLLFVYSPDYCATEKEYFERYPGNDQVDVLGNDIYHFNGTAGSQVFIEKVTHSLAFVTKAAAIRNKVAALSETGLEGLSVSNWWTGVIHKAIAGSGIAYFLVWRNAYDIHTQFFAPYPGQASVEDFILFKNKKDILFESQLPPMYK